MERRQRIRRANIAGLVLLMLGALQMLGAVVRSRTLQRIGDASAMAPMPMPFSDRSGLETFATDLTLGYWEPNGTEHFLRITPEVYEKIAGPYSRRAMYAAALMDAPRLPRALWTPIFCYGLRRDGPVRREIGLRPEYRDLALTIRTRTRGRRNAWTYAPDCTR